MHSCCIYKSLRSRHDEFATTPCNRQAMNESLIQTNDDCRPFLCHSASLSEHFHSSVISRGKDFNSSQTPFLLLNSVSYLFILLCLGIHVNSSSHNYR